MKLEGDDGLWTGVSYVIMITNFNSKWTHYQNYKFNYIFVKNSFVKWFWWELF